MGDGQQQPLWLGRPIASEDHVRDLETRAAINEFDKGLPRHVAEQNAHDEYVRDQRQQAAAQHLAGVKAATGTGDMESARKHGMLYEMHMRALGHDPMRAPPPEIMAKVNAPDRPKLYRFKAHPGDMFAVANHTKAEEPMTKAEMEAGSCDFTPTPSTKNRCKNPRSRKVNGRYYCHHHADLVAKRARQDESLARMETPMHLVAENLRKDDAQTPPWVSEDGLEIPRGGTKERKAWDKGFVKKVVQYAQGYTGDQHLKPKAIKIDPSNTLPRNPAVNSSRLAMYHKMALAGEQLPPVLVQREPSSGAWYLVDGNHRAEAALKAGWGGQQRLDALDITPEHKQRMYEEMNPAQTRKSEDEVANVQDRLGVIYLAAKELQKLAKSEQEAALDSLHEKAKAELVKAGVDPSLCKSAPPGWGEDAMHKLKVKVGEDRAFAIAWAQHKRGNDPKKK